LRDSSQSKIPTINPNAAKNHGRNDIARKGNVCNISLDKRVIALKSVPILITYWQEIKGILWQDGNKGIHQGNVCVAHRYNACG
jgi:hypothetical protein